LVFILNHRFNDVVPNGDKVSAQRKERFEPYVGAQEWVDEFTPKVASSLTKQLTVPDSESAMIPQEASPSATAASSSSSSSSSSSHSAAVAGLSSSSSSHSGLADREVSAAHAMTIRKGVSKLVTKRTLCGAHVISQLVRQRQLDHVAALSRLYEDPETREEIDATVARFRDSSGSAKEAISSYCTYMVCTRAFIASLAEVTRDKILPNLDIGKPGGYLPKPKVTEPKKPKKKAKKPKKAKSIVLEDSKEGDSEGSSDPEAQEALDEVLAQSSIPGLIPLGSAAEASATTAAVAAEAGVTTITGGRVASLTAIVEKDDSIEIMAPVSEPVDDSDIEIIAPVSEPVDDSDTIAAEAGRVASSTAIVEKDDSVEVIAEYTWEQIRDPFFSATPGAGNRDHWLMFIGDFIDLFDLKDSTAYDNAIAQREIELTEMASGKSATEAAKIAREAMKGVHKSAFDGIAPPILFFKTVPTEGSPPPRSSPSLSFFGDDFSGVVVVPPISIDNVGDMAADSSSAPKGSKRSKSGKRKGGKGKSGKGGKGGKGSKGSKGGKGKGVKASKASKPSRKRSLSKSKTTDEYVPGSDMDSEVGTDSGSAIPKRRSSRIAKLEEDRRSSMEAEDRRSSMEAEEPERKKMSRSSKRRSRAKARKEEQETVDDEEPPRKKQKKVKIVSEGESV